MMVEEEEEALAKEEAEEEEDAFYDLPDSTRDSWRTMPRETCYEVL